MAGKRSFKGYLSPYLDDKAVAAVRAVAADSDATADLIDRAVRPGYRLSVKWDARAKSFNATMSTDVVAENKGWVLSVYGADPVRALVGLCYTHVNLAKMNAWSDTEGLQRQTL